MLRVINSDSNILRSFAIAMHKKVCPESSFSLSSVPMKNEMHRDIPSTKILLISSAYNGMTQQIERTLLNRNHQVYFQQASSDHAMDHAFATIKPDLIICPTLMKAIPENIYKQIKCLIIHPGIMGDRGPSSIDWAILNKRNKWGVTILEADAEMDAGDIWASAEFEMPNCVGVNTKGTIYNKQVATVATKLVLDCIEKFHNPSFKPIPLDYSNPDVKGHLHEKIGQSHTARKVDWSRDSTEEILLKMAAADNQPGVKCDLTIGNQRLTRFMYNGKLMKDCGFQQIPPGYVMGKWGESICIATIDGIISVGQLRSPKDKNGPSEFKLPATIQLQDSAGVNVRSFPNLVSKERDIRYEHRGSYGILQFDFYNGAMSTKDCMSLLNILQNVVSNPKLEALIISSGPSNGIHLNVIESSIDPRLEAYQNLLNINRIVKKILTSTNILTVSALRASVGAGGVFLALASDFTFAEPNIVLNPHYKRMGLFGSELHTYIGPKRLGQHKFQQIVHEEAISLCVDDAIQLGLVDDLNKFQPGPSSHFIERVEEFVQVFISNNESFERFLTKKRETRRNDEMTKPLDVYEEEELHEMRQDIFMNKNGFDLKRKVFVYKGNNFPVDVEELKGNVHKGRPRFGRRL